MAREYDASAVPSAYDLQDAPPVRKEPGYEQVVFRGIDQMIGFTQITPEREDSDPHTHPYEQVNVLVEGRLDFLVDGDRLELEPYQTLVVPPETPHASRTVEDESAILLAFWPLREDRIEGTTYQREFPRS